jgi:hypothetical protein
MTNAERGKRYRDKHPDRTRASRLRYERKNKERVNANHRAQYHADPIKAAANRRNKKYDITQEWFDAKLKEQENKCVICLTFLKEPQVDHNHITGKNRDLLCRLCNLTLGGARDSIFVLEQAILYLKKHGVSDGREKEETCGARI